MTPEQETSVAVFAELLVLIDQPDLAGIDIRSFRGPVLEDGKILKEGLIHLGYYHHSGLWDEPNGGPKTIANKARFHHLKQVFGPLIAEGEAPFKRLSGHAVLENTCWNVQLRVDNAFTCTKTGSKEVELSKAELDSRQTRLTAAQMDANATTRSEVIYDCKPNV